MVRKILDFLKALIYKDKGWRFDSRGVTADVEFLENDSKAMEISNNLQRQWKEHVRF